MKIAYLITAYNNRLHLRRLVEALNNKNADIYIHIDKKSKATFDIPRVDNLYLIENNIEVFWGSFTFIEAVILLIKKAQEKSHYDYYALLSGTDYPVRSNEYILDFLNKHKGKEFINICKMPNNDKTLDRVEYFYYSDFLYTLNPIYFYKRIVNRMVRLLKIKRSVPKEYKKFILYGGSNWWILSQGCISYIMNFIRNNPKFVKFYNNTYIPEETFFHTIIGNSSFINNAMNSVTYADWNPQKRPLPAQIENHHIKILLKDQIDTSYGTGKMNILFARKFSDNSQEVIKKINNSIRSIK